MCLLANIEKHFDLQIQTTEFPDDFSILRSPFCKPSKAAASDRASAGLVLRAAATGRKSGAAVVFNGLLDRGSV